LPRSSLTEAGRGGLPQDPEATIPALYFATTGVERGLPARPTPVPAAAREPASRLSHLRVTTHCDWRMTALSQPPLPAGRQVLGARIAKLLRNPVLKAAGAALVVAGTVILVRSQGWLQPVELLAYDTLRVAWVGQMTGDRVLLVGATENDITAGDAIEGR